MLFLNYWNDVYNKMSKIYCKYTIDETTINLRDNDFVIEGTNLSPFLHSDYKKILLDEYHRIFKFILNDNIEIFIVIHDDDTLADYSKLFLRIAAFTEYFNVQDTPMKIIIYQTDFKKVYSTNLSVKNINSGSTGYVNNTRYIMIWRTEEIMKVMVHELIHAYDIDYYKYETTHAEALTEAMAQLYHIVFILIENGESFKKFVKYFNNNLKYGIEMANKFMKIPKSPDVNIEDYFIYRVALLVNIDEFTKFLEKKRSKTEITQLLEDSRKKLMVINVIPFKNGDEIRMFN